MSERKNSFPHECSSGKNPSQEVSDGPDFSIQQLFLLFYSSFFIFFPFILLSLSLFDFFSSSLVTLLVTSNSTSRNKNGFVFHPTNLFSSYSHLHLSHFSTFSPSSGFSPIHPSLSRSKILSLFCQLFLSFHPFFT